MFTGHVVMLPCLYLLVNFIAVGFQLLVEAVLYMFVYGMSGMVDLPVDWLPLVVLFMRRTKCRSRRSGASDQRHARGGGRHCQLLRLDISARLGGVRAAAARARVRLYRRRRRMESAGDTVAIPVLKPVLKYIVALFAGLAMPVGVYGMLLNAGLPGTSGAVPAAWQSSAQRSALSSARWSSASPCASRARSGAAARSRRPCAASSWSAQSVTHGLRPPHPGYRAGQKRAHHLQRLQLHVLRGAEHSGRGGHPPRRRDGAREDHGRHQHHQSAADLQATNGKVLMREYTPPTRARVWRRSSRCSTVMRRAPRAATNDARALTYANIGYETESGDYLFTWSSRPSRALDLYENAIVPDCADGTMGRA